MSESEILPFPWPWNGPAVPPDQETTGVGGVGPPEEFIGTTFPPPDAVDPATIGATAGASVIGRMPFPAES